MEIVSFAHFGYEGEIIKVEADLRRGIPAVDLVGLPDGAVREARERMRAAVRNSGFEFPRERILINLSPADLRKEGSSFDLSIALAVLGAANGMLMQEPELRVMVLGELELSGTVRPVKGVLAAVSRGLECGIRHYIVPEENRAEAEIRSEAVPSGVHTLNDAYFALASLLAREAGSSGGRGNGPGSAPAYMVRWREPDPEFSEVRGQYKLVRALQIAAAGGHHLLAYGPPGSGKTLALTRFPALLPLLDSETAVTVTRIHSLAGFPDSGGNNSPLSGWHPAGESNTQTVCCDPGAAFNSPNDCCDPGGVQNTQTCCCDPGGVFNTHFVSSPPAHPGGVQNPHTVTSHPGGMFNTLSGCCDPGSPWSSLLSDPPFREPHPNASLEGIAGGGRLLRPGEISLAHGGVLFLDEAAQFRASVLQALRAPLETGMVTLSRAGRTARFPARFQLLMAMNPCPCGNYAAKNRICTCSPDMVEKYWKKLSAPLLDRIDLRVHVDNPDSTELIAPAQHPAGETTERGAQAEREVPAERGAPTGNTPVQHPAGVTAEPGVTAPNTTAQHPAGVTAEPGVPTGNTPVQHPAGVPAESGVQTTTQLRIAVARAREAQWRRNRRGERRYEGMEWLNARLGPADIERVCRLSERTSAFLSQEMRSGALSGRGGHGILKVARTIADMEGSDEICEEHLTEAVSFRKWGASVPDFLLDV